jgi:GNAT superfamily N-acetyltransferase
LLTNIHLKIECYIVVVDNFDNLLDYVIYICNVNENIIVREAALTDYTRVLELIKELAAFEKEPDAVEITVEELLTGASGANPSFTCFVGEVSGRIEGIALCYFRFSTWKGKTVHLEDLIVTENMRGIGLGQKLYDRVLLYAHDHNVRRVEWVVLDWNTNAIRFYKRTGATIDKHWYLAQMNQTALQHYISNL